MCGRYQRRSDKQRIAEAFALGRVEGLALELAPNYNVAPQTMQPVVVWDEAAGMRALQMMFWRFLPPFCKDLKSFKLSTIQAAANNLLNSTVWKDSFATRRCLVPVDTFVEWETDGKRKLPWIFSMRDDSLFALGGIWRHWHSGDRNLEMNTFALITVEPNELVASTTSHDRMPLILSRADWQRWLVPSPENDPPIDLLLPFDAGAMKAWRADPRINNVRNNDPRLADAIPTDRTQFEIFG